MSKKQFSKQLDKTQEEILTEIIARNEELLKENEFLGKANEELEDELENMRDKYHF